MTEFSNDTRVIHLIQVVCQRYSAEANHWSLSIKLKDNPTSNTATRPLRCNLGINKDNKTEYDVTKHNYAVTKWSLVILDFPPVLNLTADSVSKEITKNSLHKY